MTAPGANAAPIVGIAGCGVTGALVAAHAAAIPGARLALYDAYPGPANRAAALTRGVVVASPDDLGAADVVALCHPHPHAPLAAELLARGTSVVSLSADVGDVRELLDLHDLAAGTGAVLAVGSAMSPGLSGLLARHLAAQLDAVDEVHVSTHGTGGPECARHHHASLGGRAVGWHDGEWIDRMGGSGRELCWFPEPIGAHDCYRAAMADPVVLHRSFPEAERISARVSATRRDRLTSRLPMLRPPHVGGNVGAVRVEVRGARRGGARATLIAGAAGRTASLAAAVAASMVSTLVTGDEVGPGVYVPGAPGPPARRLLIGCAERGVRIQEYTGALRSTA